MFLSQLLWIDTVYNRAQQMVSLATRLVVYFAASGFLLEEGTFSDLGSAPEIVAIGLVAAIVRDAVQLVERALMFDWGKYRRHKIADLSTKQQLDDALANVGIARSSLLYSQYVGMLNDLKRNAKQNRVVDRANDSSGVATLTKMVPVVQVKVSAKWKRIMRIKAWAVVGTFYAVILTFGLYELVKSSEMSDSKIWRLNMATIPWAVQEVLLDCLAAGTLWGAMRVIQKCQMTRTMAVIEWALSMFSIATY